MHYAMMEKTLNMSPEEIIFVRKIDRTRWLATKERSTYRTRKNNSKKVSKKQGPRKVRKITITKKKESSKWKTK